MKSPPNPKTRRARVEEKERAITRAAHDVFMERGLDGARMAEIARRADVAEGTLYLYFENKGALVRAVMKSFYEGLTAGAAQIIEGVDDPARRLELLAIHHVERCLSEWRMIELAAGGFRRIGGEQAEEVQHLNRGYVAVFDGVFREAVSRGLFRKNLRLATARDLFYGGLEYACRTAILRGHGPGSREATAAAREVARTMLLGAVVRPAHDDEPTRLEKVTARLEKLVDRLDETH